MSHALCAWDMMLVMSHAQSELCQLMDAVRQYKYLEMIVKFIMKEKYVMIAMFAYDFLKFILLY